MPGVDVYSKSSVSGDFGPSARESLKTSVRRFGTANFSVAELVLNDRDFSFKFHAAEEGDELTNDIIVRIRLHAFEDRLDALTDDLSTKMARYIAKDLDMFFPIHDITVGVELMVAEVMWGTASTAD